MALLFQDAGLRYRVLKEQFSEPALLIATKVVREETFIDGDALVSSSPFGLDVPSLNTSSASSAGESASHCG